MLFLLCQVRIHVDNRDQTGSWLLHCRASLQSQMQTVRHSLFTVSTFFILFNKKQKLFILNFLFFRLIGPCFSPRIAAVFSCCLVIPFSFLARRSCVDSDLALFVVSECFRWIPFAMLSVRQADTVKDSQPTRCTVRRASM